MGCQGTVWDPAAQKGYAGVRSEGDSTRPQRKTAAFESPAGQELTSLDPPECSKLQNSTGQETNAGSEIVWFKVTQGERSLAERPVPSDSLPCLPPVPINSPLLSPTLSSCLPPPFSWCCSLNTGPCSCWVCTCPPRAHPALTEHRALLLLGVHLFTDCTLGSH